MLHCSHLQKDTSLVLLKITQLLAYLVGSFVSKSDIQLVQELGVCASGLHFITLVFLIAIAFHDRFFRVVSAGSCCCFVAIERLAMIVNFQVMYCENSKRQITSLNGTSICLLL